MTPHIEAKKESIAKTVIMPGDPLRAKMIAETFLKEAELVNNVRGMLAYTGYFNDTKITVMASGMGMPSIGIYSYELFKFYDVDRIIRVGSCGSYSKDINLYDLILVDKSYSTSSYAKVQNGCPFNTLLSSKELNNQIIETAKENNMKLNIGTVYSTDVFYSETSNIEELTTKYNCLATEMESFALFHNANLLNKDAACILTVSDNIITGEETSPLERQNAFKQMIELALKSIK